MQTSSSKLSVSLLFLVSLGGFGCGQAPDAGPDAAPEGGAGASPRLWHSAKQTPARPIQPAAGAWAAAGNAAETTDDAADAAGGAADGSGSGSAGAAPGDAPAPVASDHVSPQILSVTPPNGAVGVKADAPIVISFSEPMARSATLAAFASETLPRAQTRMTWDETGMTLTIQPDSPLEYAHATLSDDESLELDAKQYGYTLTRFATDLAGNPLAETSVTFSTLREVRHSLSPVPALTGALRGTGEHPRLYGFVSFDAEQLPSGILALEQAVARSRESYAITDPVPVYHVQFDALTPAATTEQGTLLVTLPRGMSGDQVIPESVSHLLIPDYLERSAAHHYTQLRLDLPAALTLADAPAVAQLLEQTSLELDYLLP